MNDGSNSKLKSTKLSKSLPICVDHSCCEVLWHDFNLTSSFMGSSYKKPEEYFRRYGVTYSLKERGN